MRQRVRPGCAREVGEAQPQNDGAPDPAGAPHAPGDAVDQRDQRRVDRGGRPGRPAERALSADRAPAAAHLHRPGIAVVRQRVQMPARGAAQHRHEGGLVEPRNLSDRGDAAVVQLGRGHPADAPEPFDRERMQERELGVGRHDEQAVGLGHAACHLGQELRPRHPDGDGQADPLADGPPQPGRDLDGRARDPAHPAHVEKRLVDRQPLDQRGGVLEHPVDRPARLGVCRHPRPHDDRLRAQAAGIRAAHRGAHAVRLGLVAGREHDSRPDDDRPPAQARVVSLLDRRVERVEIGVQDRRLGQHERMFAHPRLRRSAGDRCRQ